MNLKELAIVTTLYTGIKLWKNDDDIAAFANDAEWFNNKEHHKERIKDRFIELWGEVNENPRQNTELGDDFTKVSKPSVQSNPNLITVLMMLEPEVRERLEEECEAEGITISELVERWVIEKVKELPIEIALEVEN